MVNDVVEVINRTERKLSCCYLNVFIGNKRIMISSLNNAMINMQRVFLWWNKRRKQRKRKFTLNHTREIISRLICIELFSGCHQKHAMDLFSTMNLIIIVTLYPLWDHVIVYSCDRIKKKERPNTIFSVDHTYSNEFRIKLVEKI